MQLRHGLAFTQLGHVQVDLAAQVPQIWRGPLVVSGNDLVAGTVVTQGLTKRDVHIKGQRQRHTRRTGSAQLQCLGVIGSRKSLDKAVCGGVGGVSRARHIVTGQEFRGHRQSLGGCGLHEYPRCRPNMPILPSRMVDTGQI